MNSAAFLTNLRLVSIFSQLIISNISFFLTFFHIRFLFWVCWRHSTSRCFTDCRSYLRRHSGELKPSIFLEWKNFLKLIFFIYIGIISVLAFLPRLLYIFSIFFLGFGQIAYNFLLVLSLVQAIFHYSKALHSSVSLTIACNLPNFCSSDV